MKLKLITKFKLLTNDTFWNFFFVKLLYVRRDKHI